VTIARADNIFIIYHKTFKAITTSCLRTSKIKKAPNHFHFISVINQAKTYYALPITIHNGISIDLVLFTFNKVHLRLDSYLPLMTGPQSTEKSC